MADDEQAGTPVTPSPRRLFGIALLAAVLGLIVTLSFGYADHHPTPHDVRLAVFVPPQVRQELSQELAQKDPGAFTVLSDAPSARAAEHSVRDQSALGALIILPTSQGSTALIVTAGAQGTTAQTVITKVLTAVASATHSQVSSVDVARLRTGDESGLGAFVFGLGLLIPSVIGSVLMFLLGRRMRVWWRVLAALIFALLAACGGTLAMDTIFGSLTGAGAELIGVGFLGAATFVLFIAAIQALIGLPGTGLAAVAFVFVGNAISGGSVPVSFLPNVFRQIAPWLPNNAIIRGVRDVIYYNGHDLGHSLLVLGIWVAVSLVILIGVDALQLRARARMPHLVQEIYSASGIAHLRGQFSGAAAQDQTDLGEGEPAPTAVAHLDPPDPATALDPHAVEPSVAVASMPATHPAGVEHLDPPAPPPPAADPRAVEHLDPPTEEHFLEPPTPEPAAAPTPAAAPSPAVAPTPAAAPSPVAAPTPTSPVPAPAPAAVPVGDRVLAPANGLAHVSGNGLAQLPANSGFPTVPNIHRREDSAGTEVSLTADHVTVRARTVVITADEIQIAQAPPAVPEVEADSATD